MIRLIHKILTSDEFIKRKQKEAIHEFLLEHSPLIDPEGPTKMSPDIHCCEYTLMNERERLRQEASK